MEPVLVLWWAAIVGRNGHVPWPVRAAHAAGRTGTCPQGVQGKSQLMPAWASYQFSCLKFSP